MAIISSTPSDYKGLECQVLANSAKLRVMNMFNTIIMAIPCVTPVFNRDPTIDRIKRKASLDSFLKAWSELDQGMPEWLKECDQEASEEGENRKSK